MSRDLHQDWLSITISRFAQLTFLGSMYLASKRDRIAFHTLVLDFSLSGYLTTKPYDHISAEIIQLLEIWQQNVLVLVWHFSCYIGG